MTGSPAVGRAGKNAVAAAIGELVSPGSHIALGTGSTIEACLPALAAIPGITATPTSAVIAAAAAAAGLTLVPLSPQYDLYLDGANQVAPSGDVIKGSWGAHVREKLLAQLSQRRILLCDDTKLVPFLSGPVPVAVLPLVASIYGAATPPTLDENGLVLVDFANGERIDDPATWDRDVTAQPGVVSTGLFPAAMIDLIMVGRPDGSVERRALITTGV